MGRLCQVLVLLMFSLSVFEAKAEKITLAGNYWPPFLGNELRNGGYAADLITTVFSEADIHVDVVTVPWPRALRGVSTRDYDGLLFAWFNDERAKKLEYSVSYHTSQIRLLKRKTTSLSYSTLSDLVPYTIAVGRGYAYDPEFDSSTLLRKETVRTFLVGLEMLVRDRVDLVVGDINVINYELKKNAPQHVSLVNYVDKPVAVSPLYLTISKKHPEHKRLINIFNSTYKKLQADGTVDTIKLLHGMVQ